jgi:spore coat polysaccharide biosynthesis protein SpsF
MHMSEIVAIVQARMGSTRLPGKVLMNLIGKPMLMHVVTRIARSERIDRIVVATTRSSEDDVIVRMCKENNIDFFRGDETDVLDRYYQTAKKFGADIIVRLTSDCPLIDPTLIDRVIEEFVARLPEIDYVSNIFPERTFPRGLDTEVLGFSALERSWIEDENPLLREHVTQYILRNPQKFKILGIRNDCNMSDFRWTVDTNEDFQLVTEIYSYFGHNYFSWSDVLTLIDKKPELLSINKDIHQKEVFIS